MDSHPASSNRCLINLRSLDSFKSSSTSRNRFVTFGSGPRNGCSRLVMEASNGYNRKIVTGSAGYVLEDVPHLSDYIPDLPTYPNPLQDNPAYSVVKQYFVNVDDTVAQKIVVHKDSPRGIHFRRAGPRQRVYFESDDVQACIVTCGGLCPGLNTVIREIVCGLHHMYGVKKVLGIEGGYRGFYARNTVTLTPKVVNDIHKRGGTVIGTSRGGHDTTKIVDSIQDRGINQVYIIGGDGTQRGASVIFEEIRRRGLKVAVAGIPKTIDNDIPVIDKTFGFDTAVEEAQRAINAAHVEAESVENGIGVVKLVSFLFPPIQSQLQSYRKQKHFHPISPISLPPAPSPQAVSPSYNENSTTEIAVFNVLSFGATGNGVTDDTQAFKMAWDAACEAEESGILVVPNGYSFMIQSTIFTGPCKSSIIFQIDGTIMPPDGPDSWPRNNSKRQWLVFYRINEMSLQGGGVIDGRGENWWNLPCKPHKGKPLPGPCDSPVAIRFFLSSNLTVQGLRVQNSPQFHFRFDGCQNVLIDFLNIRAPALSPNTDGIHIENTNNVKIYNTAVSNGDDCVSIGAGSYNVDIRNITCGPSHGISIGSLGNHNSRACVSNITVSDSVIRQSDNGVRIKTWQGGSGSVSKVTFHNIYMDTVRNPIIIDQFYCLTKNCPNQTSAVLISDISYTNIKGTYDVRSPPIRLACSDSVPCTNLTLSEVELLPAQGYTFSTPFCWNAYGIMQTISIPPVFCLLEGLPQKMQMSDVDQC